MKKTSIEQLLDIGIQREEESYEFYKFAAKQTKNEFIQNIFLELAGEELKHKDLLLRFKRDPELTNKLKAPEKDFKLTEKVELPDLSDQMKPAEALNLAMSKEHLAVEFYRNLALQFKDKTAKELCLKMANMELHHKQKLENAYSDIDHVEEF